MHRVRANAARTANRGFGFTLIELMVVIAIIVVLAALLLPVLSRARAQALNAQCINNLHQITLSFKTAVDDDAGQLGGLGGPLGDPYVYGSSAVGDWFSRHWGKPNEGWICPCAPEVQTQGNPINVPGPGLSYAGTVESAWRSLGWGWWDGTPGYSTNRVGSYTGNSWLCRAGWWGVGWAEWAPQWLFNKDQQIARPAQTPVLADGVAFWAWPTETDFPALNLQTGQTQNNFEWWFMNLMTIPRHGSRPKSIPRYLPPESRLPGAINVSFYDGHVASVRLENLWQQEWHRDWQPLPRRPGL